MPLTHTKDLFAKALKGKYALGAFNVNNMEFIQAIVEACEEKKPRSCCKSPAAPANMPTRSI